ncbi:MAG: DUF4411 family protein [Crocosphaera sp.]
MQYLLDANVFIEAKNRYYGLDFCPAFWEWLIQKNDEQRVFSIEAVYNELTTGKDNLSSWATLHKNNFFLSPNSETLSQFPVVSNWAMSQDYKQTAINQFLDVADYYLVSHALGNSMTVVTHEKRDNSKRKIKIPNACQALGVQFTDTFEMLRSQNANFVLGSI